MTPPTIAEIMQKFRRLDDLEKALAEIATLKSYCDLSDARRIAKEALAANDTAAELRAEIERMRPVFELAVRWCNRPLDVTRGWLANDAELFAELHKRVEAVHKRLEAAEASAKGSGR